MPTALVGRLGSRNEFAEFKTVLNDAGNHIRCPVDAEAMAHDLVERGGRELVEVVRELTAALASAEREREEANRRYERLTADLARRGIPLEAKEPPRVTKQREPALVSVEDLLVSHPKSQSGTEANAGAEWEEWDRKFRSLLETL